MQETIKLVSYGVDTLILNVRYSDSKGQPVKQELDEKLVQELDYLQGEARRVETAVATDWAFQSVLLFVEPHGAGKQWRWLLTSRLLNLAVSRGKFNEIIAQVRFSSEYLWSQAWCGDALCKAHSFLMSIFGEYLHLQLSEVHLCADIVEYDFSQCNYETQFVTRVRKRIREKNLERGIASTIGYVSTLAAWLGGEYVSQESDVFLVLHWLAEAGPEYLQSKQRDFLQEVRKKQKRDGTDEREMAS